jgi:VanZ family protein
MTARGTAGRDWVSRTGYALVAIAWAAFVAYGSVVPFSFRRLSFGAGIQHFVAVLSARPTIDSNTDFVTNVLLTIPLGYVVMAALRTDRRSRLLDLAVALVALPMCFLYSAAVEFSQEFFSGRTPSASDVAAQIGGAIFGAVLWLVVGPTVTVWLRDSLRERERPAMVQRLLLAYCVLFVITQVLPLDLTLNMGQLAQKYRRGGVLLIPFQYPYPNTFERFWDYFGDALTNVPVGAAATLLWTYGRSRRSTIKAAFLAIVAVGLIELAQVFVRSRIADMTDVITGSFGAFLGIAAANRFSDREVVRSSRDATGTSSGLWLARLGAVVWVMLLASYHWNPFNFTAAPERVSIGIHQFLSVPFSSYYSGTEFHALTEMLRKFLLALPLGLFLRVSTPRRVRQHRRFTTLSVAAIGFAILVAIEFGQVFLPTRVADLTDAIVAELGVVTGSWLASRFASAAMVGEPPAATEPAATR